MGDGRERGLDGGETIARSSYGAWAKAAREAYAPGQPEQGSPAARPGVPAGEGNSLPAGLLPGEVDRRPPTDSEALESRRYFINEHEATSWDRLFSLGAALVNGTAGYTFGRAAEQFTASEAAALANIASDMAAMKAAHLAQTAEYGQLVKQQLALDMARQSRGALKGLALAAGVAVVDRTIDETLFPRTHSKHWLSFTNLADYIASPALMLAPGRLWLRGLSMVGAHTLGKVADGITSPPAPEPAFKFVPAQER